jgi:hypothetical protein
MAYPIQTQVFSVFLGTQEGIHSVALPSIYSSSGSRNLWIDKLGRAKKIHGYSKQNSSAVTTNTGSAATRLRALRAYRQTGSSFTRQLLGVFEAAANEYELWYSTNDGAAWTFIVDLGSGSIGSIPDFAQVDNNLFFTNWLFFVFSGCKRQVSDDLSGSQYGHRTTERLLYVEDGQCGCGRGAIRRKRDLQCHSIAG